MESLAPLIVYHARLFDSIVVQNLVILAGDLPPVCTNPNITSGSVFGGQVRITSIDELAVAIRNAVAGKPTLAPEAALILMAAATRQLEPTYDLTNRELDVLTQMVEGRTNPEIADLLSISRSTAKTHVSNILGKLNVTNRIEAVKLALKFKLI